MQLHDLTRVSDQVELLHVIVNARLLPSFLWIAAVVFVLTAYLGYAYWDEINLLPQLIEKNQKSTSLFCFRRVVLPIVVGVPSVSSLIPATAGRPQLLVSRVL